MESAEPAEEAHNPWTIVNLVFHHLVDHGCHPTLGAGGDPGEAAAALLHALGIQPAVEAEAQATRDERDRSLADLRAAMLDEP